MARELSWTPVRNGPIYCSTACGGGCKHAAYLAVAAQAEAMCAALGPAWEPRVNENLGWHCHVQLGGDPWGQGGIRVSAYRDTFTAFADGQAFSADTALEAVAMARKTIEAKVAGLNNLLALMAPE